MECSIKMGLRKNRMGSYGLNSSDSEQGPMVGSCERGYEPSIFICGGEFLN
jgi:hypothetical protein